jgi:hypothetical protein
METTRKVLKIAKYRKWYHLSTGRVSVKMNVLLLFLNQAKQLKHGWWRDEMTH